MTNSIILVLLLTGIFCLLLTTTIILLTLAVAYWYYIGSTVDDVNVPPASTSSVVPPMAITLPPIIPKTAVDLSLLVRNKRSQMRTMPTIPEETLQEIVWAAAEVPARQQMRKPPVLLTGNSKTSDDSGDAYMILSGKPPSMPVILEETEEDLLRENFRVTPLTGKYRPPAMPAIPEETEKDLEWENFCVMPLTGKHRPSSMTVIPEETDEDLELEQKFSNVLLLVPDTCTHTPVKTWAKMKLQVQEPPSSVEPVLVHTSNKPTICSNSSASLTISSSMFKITRGIYKGSNCTVVRFTAKMVEVQILGESQTRRIMQTSLSCA